MHPKSGPQTKLSDLWVQLDQHERYEEIMEELADDDASILSDYEDENYIYRRAQRRFQQEQLELQYEDISGDDDEESTDECEREEFEEEYEREESEAEHEREEFEEEYSGEESEEEQPAGKDRQDSRWDEVRIESASQTKRNAREQTPEPNDGYRTSDCDHDSEGDREEEDKKDEERPAAGHSPAPRSAGPDLDGSMCTPSVMDGTRSKTAKAVAGSSQTHPIVLYESDDEAEPLVSDTPSGLSSGPTRAPPMSVQRVVVEIAVKAQITKTGNDCTKTDDGSAEELTGRLRAGPLRYQMSDCDNDNEDEDMQVMAKLEEADGDYEPDDDQSTPVRTYLKDAPGTAGPGGWGSPQTPRVTQKHAAPADSDTESPSPKRRRIQSDHTDNPVDDTLLCEWDGCTARLSRQNLPLHVRSVHVHVPKSYTSPAARYAVRCLWASCPDLAHNAQHTVQLQSLKKHINRLVATRFACTFHGCRTDYSALWRVNAHIKVAHPGHRPATSEEAHRAWLQDTQKRCQ